MQKQRIWELDAFRGLLVLVMVVVHLIYDLRSFFQLPILAENKAYNFFADWGGVQFLVLSGICVSLGSRPVRRGLKVFLCGLLITAVTAAVYLMDMADISFVIWFGVLHCLGVCMMLWPAVKKLPWWALLTIGLFIILVGLYIDANRYETGMWLIVLGFAPASFASSDYFPLLPFFGFFLAGAALGKTLYKNKKTLFPRICPENFVIRGFCWVGKRSLLIYILHQPILLVAMYALEAVL